MQTQTAFDNSYARLPERFHVRQPPTPVEDAAPIAVNADLARELNLDPDWLAGPDGMAMLAGNTMPDGAEPLAQAYAGHQFGGWVPQLGDGRALLLGEVIDREGRRRDIQLKGSGPTPFSRMGDGRAWLGPVLREYLVSEAMHAMGIPTTRALAAVTTGETVMRERPLPGAVLTRVASSHVRVGTFQYFAARQDIEALRLLCDHAIERHHPRAGGAAGLLDAVIEAQAQLIAGWMGAGFIHGVMNTDNMAISGETIDYGPCAFMDAYHPERVFSSIDRGGRYAYARQPDIAVWNLAQFASCLLPLYEGSRDDAIAQATEAVHAFPERFLEIWTRTFRRKIGLIGAEEGDAALIGSLLDRMAATGADFTRVFRGLADGAARAEFPQPEAFDGWAEAWQERRVRDMGGPEQQAEAMRAANPAVIPRNHKVEEMIAAALQGDYQPFHTMLAAVTRPFEDNAEFGVPPPEGAAVTQTFCGT